ncbi:MAG: hypothetical protein MK159_02845 [Halobacteriales archaeon]|nr:hypothetical protein [Chloroflexota bacterium]MCH2453534.1 hypothetical protein [Halobacteriales archaeon]
MSILVPMPLLDDFLVNYNLGQVILAMFILSLPVGFVFGSRKITAINVSMFGLLLTLAPSLGGGDVYFGYLGIILLVLGPMIYSIAK